MRYVSLGFATGCSRSRKPCELIFTQALPSSFCQPCMPGLSFEPVSGSGSQKFGYAKPATRSAPSPRTSATATLTATMPRFLIQLELVLIVLLERRVLGVLAQEAIAH